MSTCATNCHAVAAALAVVGVENVEKSRVQGVAETERSVGDGQRRLWHRCAPSILHGSHS